MTSAGKNIFLTPPGLNFHLTENDINKFSNKQTNDNKYNLLLIPKWKYFCAAVALNPLLWVCVMLCWLLSSDWLEFSMGDIMCCSWSVSISRPDKVFYKSAWSNRVMSQRFEGTSEKILSWAGIDCSQCSLDLWFLLSHCINRTPVCFLLSHDLWKLCADSPLCWWSLTAMFFVLLAKVPMDVGHFSAFITLQTIWPLSIVQSAFCIPGEILRFLTYWSVSLYTISWISWLDKTKNKLSS